MGANATVSAIIGSLAWPATVLVALVLLKESVRGLLARLISFKASVGEATFSDQLGKLTERVEETDPVPQPPTAELDEPTAQQSRSLQTANLEKANWLSTGNAEFINLAEVASIAAVSPSGAILAAWKQVETGIESLYVLARSRLGDDRGSQRTRTSQITTLFQSGLLSPSLYEVLTSLRKLRNTAVHTTTELTPGEAIQFATLANDAAVDLSSTRLRYLAARGYTEAVGESVKKVAGSDAAVEILQARHVADSTILVTNMQGQISPIYLEVAYSPAVGYGTTGRLREAVRRN